MKMQIMASVAAVALFAAPVLAQDSTNTPTAAAESNDSAQQANARQGKMMQKLSPEGQEAVKKLFNSPEEAEYRKNMQAQQKKMHELVGADELDLEAIRTEMGNLNKLTSEHTMKRQQLLLATLPTLTTADRKALAKIGERRMGRMHKAKGDRSRRGWKAHKRGAQGQAGEAAQQQAPAAE